MTQATLDAEAQTTLGYWAELVDASIIKPCPVCNQPVAARRLHTHLSSEACEPAADARANSEFGGVAAR